MQWRSSVRGMEAMYDQILIRSSGGRRGKRVKEPVEEHGTEPVGPIEIEVVDWIEVVDESTAAEWLGKAIPEPGIRQANRI